MRLNRFIMRSRLLRLSSRLFREGEEALSTKSWFCIKWQCFPSAIFIIKWDLIVRKILRDTIDFVGKLQTRKKNDRISNDERQTENIKRKISVSARVVLDLFLKGNFVRFVRIPNPSGALSPFVDLQQSVIFQQTLNASFPQRITIISSCPSTCCMTLGAMYSSLACSDLATASAKSESA